MNTPPSAPHDDGLEWLREVRRTMLREAGGDLKKLGDRYRRSQSEHPETVFDPRETVLQAARSPRVRQ